MLATLRQFVTAKQESDAEVNARMAALKARCEGLHTQRRILNSDSYRSWSCDEAARTTVGEKLLQEIFKTEMELKLLELNSSMDRLDTGFLSEKHGNGTPRFAVHNTSERGCTVGYSKIKTRSTEDIKELFVLGIAPLLLGIASITFCALGTLAWWWAVPLGIILSGVGSLVICATLMTQYTSDSSLANNLFLAQYKLPSKKVGFTCYLEGIVPSEVKKRVAEVKDKFQHVAVIAETQPDSWGKAEPVVVPRDPIVVGINVHNGKPVCHIIASFNLSTGEEHATREFGG